MTIDTDDLAALSRLLDDALDLEPAEFEPWLSALSREHRHLVPRLRDMLAHRNATVSALDRGPQSTAPVSSETVVEAGDRVGPYRLVRELGNGGMGTVWLAERADGAMKRTVALKLPRLSWGRGLAERMARERDIGALLEHPNIARLYDAGVDTKGRPYLALEFIDGTSIDAWCRERAVDLPTRLGLFLQVIRAVAYAHGRLVVHRDIKPSNVLVTPDGQAHLLDFGIAKLLEEATPGENRLTQAHDRLLTPHYASPEQMDGETLTVGSDVYSLGVLLYELLTGHLPTGVANGHARMPRRAANEDPPLASSLADDKATARALRGELDAILGKALKRHPHERYATADALADDIQRHLDGERVVARPDSLAYRLSKAARRHRTGFVATAIVLLTIVGGAGVAIVEARHASNEASRANDEAARARVAGERVQIVKEFLVDVLNVEIGNDVEARRYKSPLLEQSAELIEGRFAGQPALKAELYDVVQGIFFRMGAYPTAVIYADRRAAILASIGASRTQQAAAVLDLVRALLAASRLEEAELQARRALDLAEPHSREWLRSGGYLVDVLYRLRRPDDALQISSVVGNLYGVMSVLRMNNRTLQRFNEHKSTFVETLNALEEHRTTLRDYGAPALARTYDANTDFYIGCLYLAWGDLITAKRLIEPNAASFETTLFHDNAMVSVASTRQLLSMSAGRVEESQEIYQALRPILGKSNQDRGMAIVSFNAVESLNRVMQGRFDDAESLWTAPARTRARDKSTARFTPGDRARLLARIKLARGQHDEAAALLPEPESDGENGPIYFADESLRGEVLCAANQRRQGLLLLDHFVKRWATFSYEHHPELARVRAVMGSCALAEGDVERAAALAKTARTSLTAQSDVSPYFKRPSDELDRQLAAVAR